MADVWCVALIVAVITLAFLPIFLSLDKFPAIPRGNDWFKECAFNRSAREAILRDRQIPLRSPYFGGGYPLVAYPEDSSLSPLFVTTLLFGENAGLKLRVFIKLLVGALGMYYLLRVGLSCPPGGAALGSLFFGLADWFHAKIGHGYIGLYNYYFLPLLMGLLLDASRGRRSILLPSLVFALMLIDGKFVIAVSMLFLCLWGLPEMVRLRRRVAGNRSAIVFRFAFFEKLAMVVCLGCVLSAAKLLPMLALLGANPRTVSYQQIWREWSQYGWVFYKAPGLLRALLTPSPPEQNHIGLGWIAIGLALLAAVLHLRALARWVLLLVLFVWLCLGYWAPLDLFHLLWRLPIFGSINKPAFWLNFFVMMPVCVLAASLFRGGPRSKTARCAYVAYLCVGAVGVALLCHRAYQTNASHFTQPLGARVQAFPFFQVEGNGKYHAYHNMVQGIGTIDWDGDILLPEFAVPAFLVDSAAVARRNERYRGEVWLAEGRGSARLTRLTANAIDVEFECSQPATIVVNQNFDPGWRSSSGKVRSRGGLLAISDLPAGRKCTVTLRYTSHVFLIGLAISGLSLAAVAWQCVRRLRTHGWVASLAGTNPPDGYRPREVAIEYGAWSARTRIIVTVGLTIALAALTLLAVPCLRTERTLRSAQVLLGTGQTAPAAERSRSVLESDPQNRVARELLGACYYDDARWEEAAAELGRAMQLGKMDAQSYALLARSYRHLGQWADAEQTYREALAAYPCHRLARQEFAAFREARGQAGHLSAPNGVGSD